MIESVLLALFKANLALGVAVLVVLALRRPVRPRFGARAAYALWLAPLAAALAALPPHPASKTALAPLIQTAALSAGEFVASAAPTVPTSFPMFALVAWMVGALAAAAILARRQARFLGSLGRLEPAETLGVLRASRAGVGPAVVGALRPRIVTPADFETRFTASERALILAHERVHVRCGDAAINALACVFQCLCWFNPLVHLAVRLLRIDQELACDAAVIGRFPAARRDYAELLLKTQLVTQPLPLGCLWPAREEHPLKVRIVMLKSALPEPVMRAAGWLVAGCLGIGAGGLAWAAQPGPDASIAPGLRARGALAVAAPVAGAPALARADQPGVGQAGPREPVVPVWVETPNSADVARAYPAKADQDGMGGQVTLACRFVGDGRLTGCRVVSETPPEDGFGAAALELASRFRANPLNGDGVRVEGAPVRIPIRFSAPGGAADYPSPQAVAITRPIWVSKPTPADMARLYPREAAGLSASVAVVLNCVVGADGRLQGCGVANTAMKGPSDVSPDVAMAFGTATLQLAKIFQMQPQSADGAPVAGQVIRIPVLWSPTPAATTP